MHRGVKLALASGVLLLGTTVALFYRHSPSATTEPTNARPPILRQWTGSTQSPDPERPRLGVTKASPVRHPRATILAALERNEPPPELARVYPRPDDSSSAAPVSLPDYQLPEPADSRPALRIHKVADGDTLALLAERYLGSADRAMEIFELNREVLRRPDALPIGVELRIPSRSAPAPKRDKMLPERPMVPVQL